MVVYKAGALYKAALAGPLVAVCGKKQLHSGIYSGQVWHHRHAPRSHKFSYRVFMMYVDLAEIDEVLAQSRFWSTWRFAPACFRRADYFSLAETSVQVASDAPEIGAKVVGAELSGSAKHRQSNTAVSGNNATEPPQTIDHCVRSAVESSLGVRPDGPIRVLTNFRYFGFLINPISCYYCFNQTDEKLDALLIEVTNTPWEQRTHYVLDLRQYQSGQAVDFDKDMHVSPFMPMNMKYRWTGSPPAQQLRYTLTSFLSAEAENSVGDHAQHDSRAASDATSEAQERRQFDSGVNFSRIEINPRSLNRILLQYPWMTGKVAAAIYWQALKLWLKRIPFVPHPDKAGQTAR